MAAANIPNVILSPGIRLPEGEMPCLRKTLQKKSKDKTLYCVTPDCPSRGRNRLTPRNEPWAREGMRARCKLDRKGSGGDA